MGQIDIPLQGLRELLEHQQEKPARAIPEAQIEQLRQALARLSGPPPSFKPGDIVEAVPGMKFTDSTGVVLMFLRYLDPAEPIDIKLIEDVIRTRYINRADCMLMFTAPDSSGIGFLVAHSAHLQLADGAVTAAIPIYLKYTNKRDRDPAKQAGALEPGMQVAVEDVARVLKIDPSHIVSVEQFTIDDRPAVMVSALA